MKFCSLPKTGYSFYKTHNTGPDGPRISEDVSRVRMFTDPAVMYLLNAAATIGFFCFICLRRK